MFVCLFVCLFVGWLVGWLVFFLVNFLSLLSTQPTHSSSLQQNFSRLFLKNGEHTWGLDVKSTLTPTSQMRSNWSNVEFHKMLGDPNYKKLIASWYEQRTWGFDYPMAALGDHKLASMIQSSWKELTPSMPDLSSYTRYTPANLPDSLTLGNFVVSLDTVHGYVRSLANGAAKWGGLLFNMEYQTYSQLDYTFFMEQYNYVGELG